ncbi:MAG: hypothetical protein ACYCX0_06090 [Desulfurivibrionaceae bacterium]
MWCSTLFFSPFFFWFKPLFGLAVLALLTVLLFRLLRRDDSRQELRALREEVRALRQSMKEPGQ